MSQSKDLSIWTLQQIKFGLHRKTETKFAKP